MGILSRRKVFSICSRGDRKFSEDIQEAIRRAQVHVAGSGSAY